MNRHAMFVWGIMLGVCVVTFAGCSSSRKTLLYEAPDGTMMEPMNFKGLAMTIEDLKIGTGDEAKRKSIVTVHYHGTLAEDGKVFDSTRGGEPAEFPLNRLIPGWQVGVTGMRIGGIRRLMIPPQMAYGAEGAGDVIPRNATLVFTIELVGVKDPPAEPKSDDSGN